MLYFGVALNIVIASIWLVGPAPVRPLFILNISIAILFLHALKKGFYNKK